MPFAALLLSPSDGDFFTRLLTQALFSTAFFSVDMAICSSSLVSQTLVHGHFAKSDKCRREVPNPRWSCTHLSASAAYTVFKRQIILSVAPVAYDWNLEVNTKPLSSAVCKR